MCSFITLKYVVISFTSFFLGIPMIVKSLDGTGSQNYEGEN